MNNVVKKIIPLTILSICSCQALPFQSTDKSIECAELPPSDLVLKNVKDIALSNSLEKIGEGRINSTETIGYEFRGKSGHELQLELTEDICLWIIDPDNNLFTGSTLTKDGAYIVQITAPQGKRKNYVLSMGLDTNSPTPLPTVTPTPTPTPSPTSTPKPTSTPFPTLTPSPSPTSKNQLSQNEALSIVQGWYDAKPDIFGANYQTNAVRKYATGKLYFDTVEKCDNGICGGSVGWLEQNGCHYTYEFSDIQKVVNYSSSDTSAILIINVRERLQLHGPKPVGCGNAASTYTKNVTYFFEKQGKAWKINDYKVAN